MFTVSSFTSRVTHLEITQKSCIQYRLYCMVYLVCAYLSNQLFLELGNNESILTNILWILFANVFFWPEEMLKFYFCIIPSEIRKIEENFDIWHRNFFVADVKSYFCVHFGPEPCDTNRIDQLYISWFSKQLFILSSIWFGIHFAFFHQTFLWKEKFRSIDYSHTSIAEN